MNDNEKKSSDLKMIIGGIVLIVILFAGIKFIFWGLGKAIPQTHAGASASVSQDVSASLSGTKDVKAPSFCIHCGEALPEGFQWGQFCPYCGEKVEP